MWSALIIMIRYQATNVDNLASDTRSMIRPNLFTSRYVRTVKLLNTNHSTMFKSRADHYNLLQRNWMLATAVGETEGAAKGAMRRVRGGHSVGFCFARRPRRNFS